MAKQAWKIIKGTTGRILTKQGDTLREKRSEKQQHFPFWGQRAASCRSTAHSLSTMNPQHSSPSTLQKTQAKKVEQSTERGQRRQKNPNKKTDSISPFRDASKHSPRARLQTPIHSDHTGPRGHSDHHHHHHHHHRCRHHHHHHALSLSLNI